MLRLRSRGSRSIPTLGRTASLPKQSGRRDQGQGGNEHGRKFSIRRSCAVAVAQALRRVLRNPKIMKRTAIEPRASRLMMRPIRDHGLSGGALELGPKRKYTGTDASNLQCMHGAISIEIAALQGDSRSLKALQIPAHQGTAAKDNQRGSLERYWRLKDEGNEHLRPRSVGRIGGREGRGEVLLLHGCAVVEVAAQDRDDDQPDQVRHQCGPEQPGQQSRVDRVADEPVRAGGNELRFVPSGSSASPSCARDGREPRSPARSRPRTRRPRSRRAPGCGRPGSRRGRRGPAGLPRGRSGR